MIDMSQHSKLYQSVTFKGLSLYTQWMVQINYIMNILAILLLSCFQHLMPLSVYQMVLLRK